MTESFATASTASSAPSTAASTWCVPGLTPSKPGGPASRPTSSPTHSVFVRWSRSAPHALPTRPITPSWPRRWDVIHTIAVRYTHRTAPAPWRAICRSRPTSGLIASASTTRRVRCSESSACYLPQLAAAVLNALPCLRVRVSNAGECGEQGWAHYPSPPPSHPPTCSAAPPEPRGRKLPPSTEVNQKVPTRGAAPLRNRVLRCCR